MDKTFTERTITLHWRTYKKAWVNAQEHPGPEWKGSLWSTVLIFPKLIYNVRVLSTKIPRQFFVDLGKPIHMEEETRDGQDNLEKEQWGSRPHQNLLQSSSK